MNHQPRLALTMGDINGIGPEVLVKALSRPELRALCRPVVIGSVRVFNEARPFAPNCPPGEPVKNLDPFPSPDAAIPVLEAGPEAPPLRPGEVDAEAGACAAEWLIHAVRLAQAGAVDGIVTCPISKEGINRAGYDYKGHTDLIAEMTGSPDYRMSLFAGPLRVIHITGHLPLARALEEVKTDRILRSLRIARDALARIGMPQGRIAVAGLNPHAGEAGVLGTEEIDQIEPAVRAGQAEGIACSGPYPPDTVFRRMREGEFDAVIAMYHDQGHVPMKLVAMDEGVNVTLGIPIVRTSPDHGTAYDIAWQGVARDASMAAAIELAAALAGHRV